MTPPVLNVLRQWTVTERSLLQHNIPLCICILYLMTVVERLEYFVENNIKNFGCCFCVD